MVQKVAVSREFEARLRYAATANKGRIRQRKEKDGLRLSSAVPKIQWDSTPTAPTAIRLWETFAFTYLGIVLTLMIGRTIIIITIIIISKKAVKANMLHDTLTPQKHILHDTNILHATCPIV